MSQFAVLHVQKLKDITGFEKHIRRHHIPHRSNPEKVYLNEVILRQPGSLEEAIERRIKEGHTVKNKDGRVEKIHVRAVRAGSLMLTGSHERMHEIYEDRELWWKWKKANLDFVKGELGEANIIEMETHIDEKTPHIHCVFVPISKEGRLSYSSFFDGTLVGWQDRYGRAMKAFDLHRGTSKKITGKVHQDTLDWERKQIALSIESRREAEKMTEDINSWNVFRMDEVREKQTHLVADLVQEKKNLRNEIKELHISNRSLMEGRKSIAFDQSLQEAMDKRLRWIKKNIEIGPLLKERGWQVDKSRSSQKEETFVHPRSGERIIVPLTPDANGNRTFFYESGGKGTIFNLFNSEGWDWKKIRELAQEIPFDFKESTSTSIKYSYSNQGMSPQEAKRKVAAYLSLIEKTSGRDFLEDIGIEKRTHTSFHGLRVSLEAAVFPLYKNFNKEGEAELFNALTYKRDEEGNREEHFKWDVKGCMSVLVDLDYKLSEVERIIVSKSPIAALSYRQLQLEGRLHQDEQDKRSALNSTAFLSTCGNLTEQVKKDLRIVFEMAQANDQTIVLGMDNDLAGRRMRETLVHIAEESGCRYEVETPRVGKDWNEQLSLKEKDNVGQAISERRWEMFEENNYEQSILAKIAIEKETVEAFKDTIKVGEKYMITALREMGKEKISSTWFLKVKANNKFSTITDEVPAVSILKGNPQEASELVLVTSPLDALVHYQSLEFKGDKGDMCYAMLNPSKLGNKLLDFVEQDNWRHLTVVSSERNIEGSQAVHHFLRQDNQEVAHLLLDVEVLRSRAAENLGIKEETIEAFKQKVGFDLEAPQQEKEVRDSREKSRETFSLIKGDIKEGEKVILVVSKNDAMLHYEKEKATREENAKTCYVLCDVSSKAALSDAASKLKEYAQKNEIDVHIVSSKENMPAARSVRFAFKEESMRVYNERLKREIPLTDFLEKEMGWKRVENRSSRENDVLVHPKNGESIVVPLSPKPNSHRVFSYERGGGGTIIDLLQEEKWEWKKIVKLAESRFLPKIEEIESIRMSQRLASSREEELGIRINPMLSSRNEEINTQVNRPSMAYIASEGLSLLGFLMSAGLNANRVGGLDHAEENEEKEEKKKKREFGMGI